jgi:methionyl-tRNA formyltransferase
MLSKNNARIVFMGTPDFAVPSLEALVEHGWNVVCVVTQPDRPKGRKKELTPPPVKETAERLGLTVFQPEKCRHPESVETLRSYRPDLIVTAAYGQLLPKDLLELPPAGCVNVHASLLPKYRGGAPIHHAIIRGETKTGITLMYMDEGLDTGDMIRQVEVEISDTDTAGSLYDKLKIAGAKLLIDSLEEILNGQVERIPQDHSQATYAPNIKSEDERIDWNRPARDVYNQIRGLNPWPVAYTEYRGARLKIWASALPETESIHKDVNAQNVAPGTVVNTDDGVIEVAVKDGTIQLTEVQPAGKRKMTAADFIRGGQIRKGDILGDYR